MMDGKLGTDSAYEGIVFTPELRDKLLEIKTGSFAYIDEGGISHAQVEGYVMTSQVVRELKKKAERLMGGYNASEKDTIATNLNLYTKAGADARFAALENLFQDYIDFLTGQGKSPMEARQLLRNKLDVLSKDEIVKDYLRKDGKLSDLSLPTAERNGRPAALSEPPMRKNTSPCWRIRDGCTWRTAAREQVPRGCLSCQDREYRVHTGVYQYRTQGRQQLGRHRCRHPEQDTAPEIQRALQRR